MSIVISPYKLRPCLNDFFFQVQQRPFEMDAPFSKPVQLTYVRKIWHDAQLHWRFFRAHSRPTPIVHYALFHNAVAGLSSSRLSWEQSQKARGVLFRDIKAWEPSLTHYCPSSDRIVDVETPSQPAWRPLTRKCLQNVLYYLFSSTLTFVLVSVLNNACQREAKSIGFLPNSPPPLPPPPFPTPSCPY